MNIAILETGAPPGDLAQAHGDYPAMMRRMLDGAGTSEAFYETFDVQAGQLPDLTRFDAEIVTGSPAGVYDDLPWIMPLLDHLRAARGRVRMVGICFGHQAMAQAFGGQVIKSPKGFAVGRHAYEVLRRPAWMAGAGAQVAAAVSHQDQVTALPPGATVVAGSAFTPNGLLDYGDAISFQQHPEFDAPFARALIGDRRGRALAPDLADAGLASLEQPTDRVAMSGWIRNFLER
jgi:GMP synthase-like glutamine amidotransferase